MICFNFFCHLYKKKIPWIDSALSWQTLVHFKLRISWQIRKSLLTILCVWQTDGSEIFIKTTNIARNPHDTVLLKANIYMFYNYYAIIGWWLSSTVYYFKIVLSIIFIEHSNHISIYSYKPIASMLSAMFCLFKLFCGVSRGWRKSLGFSWRFLQKSANRDYGNWDKSNKCASHGLHSPVVKDPAPFLQIWIWPKY